MKRIVHCPAMRCDIPLRSVFKNIMEISPDTSCQRKSILARVHLLCLFSKQSLAGVLVFMTLTPSL